MYSKLAWKLTPVDIKLLLSLCFGSMHCFLLWTQKSLKITGSQAPEHLILGRTRNGGLNQCNLKKARLKYYTNYSTKYCIQSPVRREKRWKPWSTAPPRCPSRNLCRRRHCSFLSNHGHLNPWMNIQERHWQLLTRSTNTNENIPIWQRRQCKTNTGVSHKSNYGSAPSMQYVTGGTLIFSAPGHTLLPSVPCRHDDTWPQEAAIRQQIAYILVSFREHCM